MKQNKFLWYITAAAICWLLYASVFDLSGKLDPLWDFDVVEYRVGSRLGVIAKDANQKIENQNRAMQNTVDGRERRVRKRVDQDTTTE